MFSFAELQLYTEYVLSDNPISQLLSGESGKRFNTLNCELLQVILNVSVMCVIDSRYAIGTIVMVFIIWCYIGLANPAVKPGTANEFNFLRFLRRFILRLFR